MLSYAEVPLLDPPADLLLRVERELEFAGVSLWPDRAWPGHAQDALGYRGPWPRERPRLNVLVWPSGASRFAYGHFLATHADLQTIRSRTQPAGGYPEAKEFRLRDGRAEWTTLLYLLPALPLDRVKRFPAGDPAASGLHLLTLVDDRYFWWYASTLLEVTGGTTSWEGLFNQIGTGLGVTITQAARDPAYPGPPSDLGVSHRALPILLDAAAYSVGQRVVRKRTGAVLTQTARQSFTLHQQNLAKEQASANPARRISGHEYDLLASFGPGRHDLELLVPERVRVAFPRETNDVPGERVALAWHRDPRIIDARKAGTPFAVNTTLLSRAIPEYGSARGFPGVKAFWSTARARYAGTTLTNEEELTKLAQRVAEDWYLWQLGRATAVYEGVVDWDLEGHADVVQWEHRAGLVATRVSRSPFLDHQEDLFHYTSELGIKERYQVQLTAKKYLSGSSGEAGCIEYKGVYAVGEAECGFTLGDGVCDPIYHEQQTDLAVRLPPSPRLLRPKIATSDSAAGNVPWVGAQHARASDDIRATCDLATSQSTHYLKLTRICTGLPDDLEITNIKVHVEGHASGGSVTDVEVKLIIGGVVTGSSQHTGVALGTTDSVRTYSGSPATWGVPLAASNYDTGFGVALRYANGASVTPSDDGRREVRIDGVQFEIAFSGADGGAIEPLCIVQVWLSPEGVNYTNQEPHWENVWKDTDADPIDVGSGVVYEPGARLRYSQDDQGQYKRETVLLRNAATTSIT